MLQLFQVYIAYIFHGNMSSSIRRTACEQERWYPERQSLPHSKHYTRTLLSRTIWTHHCNEAITRADSYSSSHSTSRVACKSTPCPLYYFGRVGGQTCWVKVIAIIACWEAGWAKKAICLFSLSLIRPPASCFFLFQVRSAHLRFTGRRPHFRQRFWTGRRVKGYWGPGVLSTASNRRSTPSSFRPTTAEPAQAEPIGRRVTSEYKQICRRNLG